LIVHSTRHRSHVFTAKINDIFVVYNTKVFASQPKRTTDASDSWKQYSQGIGCSF
jgi:hypothetical protein